MTETTTPDGPAAASPSDEAGEPQAPDQTPTERDQTELLGAVQKEAERLGWTSEVVSSDVGNGGTVLGLTSPHGRDFSLMINPTP